MATSRDADARLHQGCRRVDRNTPTSAAIDDSRAASRHPLLERIRFLSISASNLDEFYSVRVAGLADQAREGVATTSADGRTPAQQLNEIRIRAASLLADQQRVWRELRVLLHGVGIEVCEVSALSDADTAWLDAWFMARAFPVLTPLAIDPAHPFPFIPNMGLVMALELRRDEGWAHDARVVAAAAADRSLRPDAGRRGGRADPVRDAGRSGPTVPRPRVPRVPHSSARGCSV